MSMFRVFSFFLFVIAAVFAVFTARALTQQQQSPLPATAHLQTIVLGSGCFWGAEKGYESLPGVIDAVSGYADGYGMTPSYREITKRKYQFDPNNFAEVVQVTYDPAVISTEALLQHFFEYHDPTQLNRQGNDIGTQYRSIILFQEPAQEQAARRLMAEYQGLLSAAGYGKIQTQIKPLQSFHVAEEYHQDYLAKNPNGYCPDHSTGVRFTPVTSPKTDTDNSELLAGQHILVLEAPHCPYCEKFNQEVLATYQGSVPVHKRSAAELSGLTLSTPTWATPTIFFIKDGVETLGHQGFMDAKAFYRALGAFKLGDTEAYRVAFGKGTDNRFCRQYEEYKNTPSGIFVDKLSGQPLFDTNDRFDSGSGWLSFSQPVADATFEKPDYSYGMIRTEVLSRSSGIHLGHVFDDGPNGQRRYCINATVLEFQPRTI